MLTKPKNLIPGFHMIIYYMGKSGGSQVTVVWNRITVIGQKNEITAASLLIINP